MLTFLHKASMLTALATSLLFSTPHANALTHTTISLPKTSITTHTSEPLKLSLYTQDSTLTYTIKQGDYLSKIGAMFGVPWPNIATVNRIQNPNLIYPHHVLLIPKAGSTGSSTTHTQVSPQPQPVYVSSSSNHLLWGPCQSTDTFGTHVWSWAVPSGCYGGVYQGIIYQGDGTCSGEVKAYLHGWLGGHPFHTTPRVGAVMFFPPGNQGASPVGHWGIVVAIGSNLLLILEQNMYWRGGGYDKITYRYVYSTGQFYY